MFMILIVPSSARGSKAWSTGPLIAWAPLGHHDAASWGDACQLVIFFIAACWQQRIDQQTH